MRALPALSATLVFLLPASSFGYCFSVYTPRNELIYQSTETPVDLSRPISVELRARYPNHHLVFRPDQSRCASVGVLPTEGSAALGFAAANQQEGPRSPRRRADRQ